MSARRSLGDRVRRLRLAANLTLEGLAERTGVSTRTLSDIERGVSTAPRRGTIDAIARGLTLDPQTRDSLRREAQARREESAKQPRVLSSAPRPVLDFTGRSREISEAVSLLEHSDAGAPTSLLICGPPGIGKTTSALEAVGRLSERTGLPVLFVDLQGLSSRPLTPLQTLRALLRQVADPKGAMPKSLDEAALLWRSASADSPAIILLDNAADESQLRSVLIHDARSRAVITSRRSLAGLEAVGRLPLAPLSTDESIALLRKLIPESQRVTGDLRQLARLCDHVPLALRIAGNRIASRPAVHVSDYILRLNASENRLRLLVAGDLAVEAAFALSYDCLEPQTAAVLRSISVIDAGTFDERLAAATVDAGVSDVDLHLDELTDLGLLEERGGNRYLLHDLVRLFAAARLETIDGPSDVSDRRHRLRMWLLRTLERAGARFEPERSPDQPHTPGAVFATTEAAEAWIRAEERHWWPAFQAAAQAGEHSTVSDVADSLHWFSELWPEWGHWLELFSLAADSARALSDRRLEAMHLGYMVWATMVETGSRPDALRLARLAVTAAEASGDHQQRGWAHFYLGWMLGPDRLEDSLAACQESLAQFRSAGDDIGAAQSMLLLSGLLQGAGDGERAIAEFRAVLERLDDDRSTAHEVVQLITQLAVHRQLSAALLSLDRPLEAVASATDAVVVAGTLRSDIRLAEALRSRATAHFAAGHHERAHADIAAALEYLDAEVGTGYLLAERAKLEALRDGRSADLLPTSH